MYLKIRAIPEAKKDLIEVLSPDTWKVSVKAPAERNLANQRIVELVAARLGLEIKQVRLISGHQSPSKILSLPDC